MLPSNRPLIIGITGSIGSGKTKASGLIEKKFPVFYTDNIAHEILAHNDIIHALESRWGKKILENKQVNRKAVADIIFNNKLELEFLNSLVHPKVLQRMQEIVNSSNEKVLVFEVPLLFEAKLKQCFDYIILIKSSRQIRINRLAKRDNLSLEDILARISTQIEDSMKEDFADLVITNDGTKENLEKAILTFMDNITDLHPRVIDPFC